MPSSSRTSLNPTLTRRRPRRGHPRVSLRPWCWPRQRSCDRPRPRSLHLGRALATHASARHPLDRAVVGPPIDPPIDTMLLENKTVMVAAFPRDAVFEQRDHVHGSAATPYAASRARHEDIGTGAETGAAPLIAAAVSNQIYSFTPASRSNGEISV